MITSTLVVGPAPDFFMKIGSVSIYHSATISLTGPKVGPRKISSSHLSFLNLIKEISQRMLAFGWTRDIKMEWEDGESLSVSFSLSATTVVVQYKIHPQLPSDVRLLINRDFRGRIKTFLGISTKPTHNLK